MDTDNTLSTLNENSLDTENGDNTEDTDSCEPTPIIVSLKTPLIPEKKAIVKTLSSEFSLNSSFKDVIDGVLREKSLTRMEIPFAKSIRKEMKRDTVTVDANGENVLMSESISDAVEEKSRELPDGNEITYFYLYIVITGIQKGGDF